MKKSLLSNVFQALALSFLAFGTVFWLAGCSDNRVKPETIAPSQPTNLTATRVDSTEIELTWTPSTDNVVVAGYNVYRGLVLAGTSPINSFTDSGLTPGTSYEYTVQAFDCSQNPSALSFPPDTATTPGPPPPPGGNPPNLRTAGAFGILAGQAVTNTGGTIISDMDLGLSPGAHSSITGFPPGSVVNGSILAADVPAEKPVVDQAKLDLTTAYNDAAGRSLNVVIVASGELGGLTLAPGLYRSGISSFAITSVNLTLNAGGNANAVFIFQMPSSTLTVGNARKVILAGSAQAKNVFWQVGTSATIGTTAQMEGNILADQSITLQTGASLHGRALARIAAVTLANNMVTKP